MSKIGVSFKIDMNKIDNNGQKGTYMDATVFIDLAELDQYGNSGMITQDVSKEEKAQNIKGNILGNCKVFWNENGQAPKAPQQQPQQQQGNYQQPQQAPQQQQGGYQQVQQQPQQAPQQQQGGYQQVQQQQQQPQYNQQQPVPPQQQQQPYDPNAPAF